MFSGSKHVVLFNSSFAVEFTSSIDVQVCPSSTGGSEPWFGDQRAFEPE